MSRKKRKHKPSGFSQQPTQQPENKNDLAVVGLLYITALGRLSKLTAIDPLELNISIKEEVASTVAGIRTQEDMDKFMQGIIPVASAPIKS